MTQPSDETHQPTDAGDRCPKCGAGLKLECVHKVKSPLNESVLTECRWLCDTFKYLEYENIWRSDACRIRELNGELSRLRERNARLELLAEDAREYWHGEDKVGAAQRIRAALKFLDHPAPQKTETDDE